MDQQGLIIAQAILEAAQILRRAGLAESRREAASLLAHLLKRDRTFLITHGDESLSAADVVSFRDLIERRASGEPLQYITGRQEFFGLDFEVTPDVLIPRPETELLVETALELLKPEDETQSFEDESKTVEHQSRAAEHEERAMEHSSALMLNRSPLICDVGTGSGCIPVAILHEREGMHAVGLDISPSALSVAAGNARHHGVSERLALIASDCFSALDQKRVRFSMIVSNPPYVAADALEGLQREVREHEPRVALTPGRDGLSIIRRLLSDAPRFLQMGGHLLLEIGFDQHAAVEQLIDKSIWQSLEIHTDLQGIPRIVALRKR